MKDEILAQKLLEYLRHETGEHVVFLEPLRFLAQGTEAMLYEFCLGNTASVFQGPLVLRLSLPEHSQEVVAISHVIQNFVADNGIPAPRVFGSSVNQEWLGSSFMIMQSMKTKVNFIGRLKNKVRASFVGSIRRMMAPSFIPEVEILRALNSLHMIDTAELACRLHGLGISANLSQLFSSRHAQALDLVERCGFTWMEPLMLWLEENRPLEAGTVLCHGDPHSGNFLFSSRRVSAIVDWTGAHIGYPESDIALVRAYHRLSLFLRVETSFSLFDIQHSYPSLRFLDQSRLTYFEAAFWTETVSSILNRTLIRNNGYHPTANPALDASGMIDAALKILKQLTDVSIIIPSNAL